MKKPLLLLFLFLTVISYKLENDVLVLDDNDFPTIIQQFPFILIQFYAPWCGHCQQLAPQYTKAAKQLKTKNSEIRLAKVDATKATKSANTYNVRGYPTLLYFINGDKLKFKGQRNAEGIIRWVQKKLLPSINQINDEIQLQKLSQNNVPSVILFSSDLQIISNFKLLALQDDNNNYYLVVSDKLLSTKNQGTIEIHRNFGQYVTFKGNSDNIKNWIQRYSRPDVLPFDQRTISSIFGDKKAALTLFNIVDDPRLTNIFANIARNYSGEIIFTEIQASSEHLNKFSEYIKLKLNKARIVLVQGKNEKKYILKQSGDQITSESIERFIVDYENRKLLGNKLTQIVVQEETISEGQEL